LLTNTRHVLKFCKDLFRVVDRIDCKNASFAKQMSSPYRWRPNSQSCAVYIVCCTNMRICLFPTNFGLDLRQILHVLSQIIALYTAWQFCVCSACTCIRGIQSYVVWNSLMS